MAALEGIDRGSVAVADVPTRRSADVPTRRSADVPTRWSSLRTSLRRRSADDPAGRVSSLQLVEEAAPSPLEWPPLRILPPVERAVDRPSAMFMIRDVLSAWRAAERELAALAEHSPERSRVEALFVAQRDAYHRLYAEHCRRSRTSAESPRRA